MKRLLIAALVCLMVTPLFAIDFGFDITNVTDGTNQDYFGTTNNVLQLDQRDRLEAWFSSTGDTYGLRLAGFYEFSGAFNNTGTAVIPYRFDAGNSFLYLMFPNTFGPGATGSLTFGRIFLSDQAGRIVSGLSDGAQFSIKTGTSEFSLMSGYTGLLSKKDANIVISKEDLDEAQNPIIYFAPMRIFAGATAKFIEIFERTDLDVELHGQFDLRSIDPTHTQYLELGMEGRPLRWFKWRAYTILEGREDPSFSFAMAAGARLQFSAPEAAGLVVLVNVDWASGTNGNVRAFAPLKQTPVAYVYRASFTDIISASINAGISPIDGVTTSLSGYGLFRASGNPPTDPAFNSTSNTAFLGIEGLLSVDFTISSDLGINIKGGAFVPNTLSDAYAAGTPARWLASLELDLSL